MRTEMLCKRKEPGEYKGGLVGKKDLEVKIAFPSSQVLLVIGGGGGWGVGTGRWGEMR